MALTPSTQLPLGTPAPHFSLPDPRTGKTVALDDFSSAPLLLVTFICNHCPYVVHLKAALVQLAHDYADRVQVVAISSNSVESHPQDSPEKMVEDAQSYGYPFPSLYDETQEVAKAYRAVCTPEFTLFDRDRKLIYRGQFDETRPEHRTAPDTPARGAKPTGSDLRRAIDLALVGKTIPDEAQKASIGCNIKWVPGNAPDYT